MRPSHLIIFVVALLAALVNVAPLTQVTPAGDAVMNYMMIDCFSKQFWSGIFYPRWCVDANGGMGSPGPIFYFPLPFYTITLFAPLGLTIQQFYQLGVGLANIIAAYGCIMWLLRHVSFKVACIGTIIFLLAGYRAELLTRTSYAEYWCVAFLPWMFYQLDKLCEKPSRYWPGMALILTLCLLSHAPVTLIGMMGAGLYALLLPVSVKDKISTLIALGASGFLATCIALFHYLPMKLLEPTLNPEMGGVNHWQRSWVNSFIDQPQVYIEHQWALICLGISLLPILMTLILWVVARRQVLPITVRRQTRCWLIIMVIALFMMFSISSPLWWLVEITSGVRTPWRMPSLIMLGAVFIAAHLIEYGWQHRKTKLGDGTMLAFFFAIASLFYYGGVKEDSIAKFHTIIPEQYVIKYFSVAHTDEIYGKEPDRFYETFIDRPHRQQAEWVSGRGGLSVNQWDAHAIEVIGKAKESGTLRLEHFYYPIWQATLNGKPITITPEEKTGRILVDIPPGQFTLRLTQDYVSMLPGWFWLCWISALLGLGAIIIGYWQNNKQRTFNHDNI